MKTFGDLNLVKPLLDAINAQGFIRPTPIQHQALPVLLSGQDILGIAQTGTGKTAAFVLPLLNKIMQRKRSQPARMCGALILSPTRELAGQIVDNIKTLSSFSKLRVVLVVGGVRPGGQIKAINAGADIIVATPGRLLDHVTSGALILSRTETIVLDEADQMLDLGFMPTIRKIMAKLPNERQTALFSATMPKQIRKLADEFLSAPVEITVAAISKPIERIDQTVRHVEKGEKRRIITTILSAPDVTRAVIFTRTKRGADNVAKHITSSDLNCVVIHGDKSQSQRDRAMASFRNGRIPIMVATDIAARGIDVDSVSHVINYDLPMEAEAYVHRIGRTARAGKSGIAISLCDPSERKMLKTIEQLIGQTIVVVGEHPSNDNESQSEAACSKPPRKTRRRPKKNSRTAHVSEKRSEESRSKKPSKPKNRNRAERRFNTNRKPRTKAAA